ncbi:Svp26p [Sporobolomyces koalae]|uniref:Svp26p n=1 Tax=Sporobolomyces koalae TaxID=500713 RepID=UPI0031826801
MVTALHCLSYVSAVVGLIFVLLSLASGLLYVAEVIEEHSALAKTIGKRLIYCIVVLYGVMYVADGLPVHLVASGIAAHLIYLTNFRKSWPTISLTSLSFIFSCIFVLLTHYLSFRHFSAKQSSSKHHYTRYNAYNHRRGAYGNSDNESFLEVATFFAVCVWLVPFYLFLSLSANDNVLPSAGESPARAREHSTSSVSSRPSSPTVPTSPTFGRHSRQRSSMMKSALSSAFSIVPSALRPASLSSNLNSIPISTAGSGDRLLKSPSPTIGFQPYNNANSSRGGTGGSPHPDAYVASPKHGSFFSSTGPWNSSGGNVSPIQPSSPSLGSSYPPPAGGSGSRGLGLGMGSSASPALRAVHPPGAPVRRHTTQADEGSFSSAAARTYDSNASSYAGSSSRPVGNVVTLGPVKRRTGTAAPESNLR